MNTVSALIDRERADRAAWLSPALLRFWLPLGVFFALLWLLVSIPAQWALAVAGQNLAASGISGTLWRGKAGNLMLRAGDTWLALGATEWHLLPLDSLRSRALCIHVASQLAEQVLQGQVCARSGAYLQARDLELALPAAATQLPGGLLLDGTLLMLVENLEMEAGQLRGFRARGSWEGAALHDGQRWIELGTLGMLSGTEQRLPGLHPHMPEWHLFDVAGPLQLNLFAGMDTQGRLRLSGDAHARATASPALIAILDFIAVERNGEHYRIAL